MLSCVFTTPTFAAEQPLCFKIWIDYSSKRLSEMGQSFLKDGKSDSALVCYSIIAGRYNKDLSAEELRVCREAYLQKWMIYFNKLYDFSKAYENLAKAEEISRKLNEIDPETEMGLAYFYETMEDNIQDNSYRIKNINHSCKAFYASLEQKNYQVLDRAFINYITASYKNKKLNKESFEVYEDYKNAESPNGEAFKGFNLKLFNLYGLILNQKYDEALKYAEEMGNEVKNAKMLDQFLYIVECVKYDIYKDLGNYSEALTCMEHVKDILKRNHNINKRSTLEVYKDIYSCHKQLGNNDAYKDYLNRYLLLKDTLLNMKQVTKMNQITFMNEINNMDEIMAEMRTKTERQNIFFVFTCLIAIIIAVSAAMLYKKNKQLAANNKKLYDNFNELQKSKDKEIERILHKAEDDEPEYSEEQSQKYKDSSLSSEEKHEILTRILKVMENVDEICSNDFSADRLAELTKTNYKNVSQVINEKFECNFNVFLNRYRIEEACRRLVDTDNYGMYTIEAISESVGFKSRTRFASNFKRIVGLTPSEYRRISLEKNIE